MSRLIAAAFVEEQLCQPILFSAENFIPNFCLVIVLCIFLVEESVLGDSEVLLA